MFKLKNKGYCMKPALILTLVVLLFFAACNQPPVEQPINGDYLGEAPPNDSAQIFAPHIVSTGYNTRDITISPDGNEIYWTANLGRFTYSIVLCVKRIDGVWSLPEVAHFSTNANYRYLEPHISPDGSKLYFASNQPDSANKRYEENFDIWYCDKTENGWSEPKSIGSPINGDLPEFFPSVTDDGSMYFTRDLEGGISRIFRSRFIDGKYSEPEQLPEQVNCGLSTFNAFVAHDESYVIVPAYGMEDTYGATDYYITYRNEDDEWCEPINLGEAINSESAQDWSPFVTRDGNYFFFMSARVDKPEYISSLTYNTFNELVHHPANGSSCMYWIKADFIGQLRP